MALPGTPIALYPKGVTDALEGSNAPKGSMAILTNLIPDPSTRSLWQCRPAAVLIADLFAAFPGTNGVITALISIGTRVYGMIGSGAFPGRDQPFCYDVQSRQVIPILAPGPPAANPPTTLPLTAAQLPFSPNPAGPWVPPSMTLCGAEIIIAHPGYLGLITAFGSINTNHPFQLTYKATNTAVNPLIFPPSWVTTFNGRVFFLVNPPGEQPAVYMSDSLNALQITNANQILTFGDNLPLTCTGSLGLLNTQVGGVIQALIIFKELSNLYQVTGDYALGNLSVSGLNAATGTLAPNSVQSTEKGIMFMAPDGVRTIDLFANVKDPIGKDGQGVTVPFINALVPSRTCAAFNSGVYRIQVQNSAVAGAPQQEWWYDTVREIWSGPHTTGVSLIVPHGATFVAFLQKGVGQLFQSDPVQSINSAFVENNGQLTWLYQTSLFPEDDKMCEFCTIETTIHMALPAATGGGNPWSSGWSPGWGPGPAGNSLTIVDFLDQNYQSLDTVLISSDVAGSLWGSFLWGVGLWGGRNNNLYPRQLPWAYPIVFRRGAIQAQGISTAVLKIGEVRMRLQDLGYLQPYNISVGIKPGGAFQLGVDHLGGDHVLG